MPPDGAKTKRVSMLGHLRVRCPQFGDVVSKRVVVTIAVHP